MMNSGIPKTKCIRCGSSINIDSKPFRYKVLVGATKRYNITYRYIEITKYFLFFNIPACEECRIKMEKTQRSYNFGRSSSGCGCFLMCVVFFLFTLPIASILPYFLPFGIIGIVLFVIGIHFYSKSNNSEYLPKKCLKFDKKNFKLYVNQGGNTKWALYEDWVHNSWNIEENQKLYYPKREIHQESYQKPIQQIQEANGVKSSIGDQFYCPFCGHLIKTLEKFCPNCGERFSFIDKE